ncbi:MAG: SUMF1/EgtB/PvdO family nonheme iron enzyme, partial [Candidatus Methylumidiphilus sp.]
YAGGELKCASNNDVTSSRAVRGGSWFSTPQFVRSANRDKYGPAYRNNYIGFRLAQD